MENKLYIIVDCSGSMFEMAKQSISMNLLSTIKEYNHSFDEIILFLWNDVLKEISFGDTEDFMLLSASGKLNFDKLEEKIVSLSQKEEELKILLFSDGNFSDIEFQSFSNRIKELSNIYISSVQIGADAVVKQLTSISFHQCVYFAEDILTAIKSLENISSQKFIRPNCINEILTTSLIEEEDMDEW